MRRTAPCRRCKRRDVKCVYEAIVRQSKAQLRAEVDRLRECQRSIEQLLTALAGPEPCEEALAHIRSGGLVEGGFEFHNTRRPSSSYTAEDIIEPGIKPSTNSMLGEPGRRVAASRGVDILLPVAAQQRDMQDTRGTNGLQYVVSRPLSQFVRSSRLTDAETWTIGMHDYLQPGVRSRTDVLHSEHMANWQRKANGKEQALPLNELGSVSLSETWTCVTGDIELTRHLLALYFCWEYPNFAPISKEHFLRDFHVRRHRYCSPMLVNALLALGCYLSDRHVIRATPGNPFAPGDNFFNESRRLFLLATDHHTLTTIQALVIMSIREARCSRVSESRYYAELAMRLAVEMGLHIVPAEGCENELAVLAKTFWGTFTLNQ